MNPSAFSIINDGRGVFSAASGLARQRIGISRPSAHPPSQHEPRPPPAPPAPSCCIWLESNKNEADLITDLRVVGFFVFLILMGGVGAGRSGCCGPRGEPSGSSPEAGPVSRGACGDRRTCGDDITGLASGAPMLFPVLFPSCRY